MKSRTLRSLGLSLVMTSSSIALFAAVFPACSVDTDGVFTTTTGGNAGGAGGTASTSSSSSSGDGGSTPSSGQGGGQGGSAGQGGSMGQTSSSSGGPVDPENCLDGLDNDKDGSIDCADTDCTEGFTCTDAPPDGWTSVALKEGDGAPPAAMPCESGAMPEELFTGPEGPAECSACACGDLTGTTCTGPTLICFPGSNACNLNQQNWTNNFQNSNCAKPAIGTTFNLSCRLTQGPMVSAPGSCAPSASDFPNKETWNGWAKACAIKTSGGGCSDGSVCVPKPADTQSLCIRADGEQQCPAGWTTTVEAFANATDDRACSACSCTPAPTCMGGSYRFFDFDQCAAGGNAGPFDVTSNQCVNVSSILDGNAVNPSWSVQRTAPTPFGSCAPEGGEPTGSVQPQGAVTFCCK